jgi:hypothetical protein
MEGGMPRVYDVAELLVASWKLAGDDDVRMPTSHGVLDHALKDLVDNEPSLPSWVRDALTFADTRVGLRCLELPEILDRAQESGLTAEPNPYYVRTAIKVDSLVCRRMLRDVGVDEAVARRLGQRMREKTEALSKEDQDRPVLIEAL